jgi:RND family efflux transporter MFP subunit
MTILLFAACSKSPPPAPGATSAANGPAPTFVAIARGKVDVEGGLMHLASARDGMIVDVRVAAGDAVKAGDVLVALDPRPVQIALDAARAELATANAQAQLLRAKMPAARTRSARVTEALSAGATSGQSADDARQALAELGAEIAVADAGIETAKQKVHQAEYELQARVLHAPMAGRIVSLTAHVGDIVSAQSGELVELLPSKPRIVRAELNEGFVAKVQVGMLAEISSDAAPGKTWSARVTRIGDVFGRSKLLESTEEATDARDVECILELAAQDAGPSPAQTLRIGQRVQVRFLPAPK